jgi:protein-serine/threonine kinase
MGDSTELNKQTSIMSEQKSANNDSSVRNLKKQKTSEPRNYMIRNFQKQNTFQDKKDSKKIDDSDFKIVEILGSGSYATVYKVMKIDNKRIYAMKCLHKENLILKKEQQSALTERNILKAAVHPFIVQLHYAFQNKKYLYFVMDFLPGKDLHYYMAKYRMFCEKWTKFYAAEILLGLEYLHYKLKVIYRDLKPENILLDIDGHIKLTDFGLSKVGERATTTCGTAQYVAPEVINDSEYGKEVDYWGFGCIIFEMIKGEPAFDALDGNQEHTFELIEKGQFELPKNISEEAKSLICSLLRQNPNARLGRNSIEEIKQHPFFAEINWEKMLRKEVKPPIKPILVEKMQRNSSWDEDKLTLTPEIEEHLSNFTYDSKLLEIDENIEHKYT